MIDEKFQSGKETALLIADIIVRESPSSDKELQSKELSILTAKATAQAFSLSPILASSEVCFLETATMMLLLESQQLSHRKYKRKVNFSPKLLDYSGVRLFVLIYS